MYKLLIVDDELAIRKGIANSNPWGKWGFEVCGLCADGLEAMEFMRTGTADVVLSDIRMPRMDGVELMQELNRSYPQVKIIILSGYSDFEYLNMSIKNNVAEYLLKPTDVEEFEQVFHKIKQKLDEERAHQAEYHELKQDFEESREYQHTNWLNTMLRGYTDGDTAEQEQEELEQAYGVYFDNCVVVLVTPDNRMGDEEKELYQLKTKIVQACNSMHSQLGGHFFLTQEDAVTGVLGRPPETELEFENIYTNLQRLQKLVEYECNVSVSIGVSELCTELDMLPQCYEQARRCARQNMFLGGGQIFMHAQFAEEFQPGEVYLDMDTIFAGMLRTKFEPVAEEFARVFGCFSNRSVKEFEYVDQMCQEAMFGLSRWALQRNIRFEKVLSSLGAGYEDIHKCDTLEKKRRFVTALFFAVHLELHKEKPAGQRKVSVAHLVRECVDAEYTNNLLSLEYVAEKTGRSPAYISKVFKNELGQNFSEYIMKKRMEKSRELLQDACLKIYEVAREVGYVDVSNYIKVFRKHYGTTPSEYRAGLGYTFAE